MKKLFAHIENLKEKPHSVRHNIAIGTASVITGIIALVWLIGTVSSGVLAIRNDTFFDTESVIVTDNAINNNNGLAGAITAFPAANQDGPARIQIINTQTVTPIKEQTEATILPF